MPPNASIFSKKIQKYSLFFRASWPVTAGFWPGAAAVIRICVHQHDVRADFLDAGPGNPEILLPSNHPKQAAGAGDHNGADLSFGEFHHHVGDKAQPSPVTDTDDLLALQLRKRHAHSTPLPKHLQKHMPGRGGKERERDQEVTLTDFRMALIAPFSNRDTCAWEIPNRAAPSIWVLPS